MTGHRPKVLVAMSGGVDSSVAAALLRAGYEVVGCFMRLGSPGETIDELTPYDAAIDGCDSSRIRIGHQGCCSINDAADARLVAAKLGIPFYVVNFKKDFGRIIDYFVGEYNAGRTPNPCVRCNDWLKFGRLHEYARQIDAQFVATGHYARVGVRGSGFGVRELPDGDRLSPTPAPRPPTPALLRGLDHSKDQSYVLFGTPRDRLGEMLLPVGGYRKSEIRAMARQLDLPVFDKPDSQEICFVPDNDYAGLVKRRTPSLVGAGAILDPYGREIGAHPGHQHFTVGQRRGVGVALGYPVYVVDRDAQRNTITVGPREMLLSDGCTARETNWLVDEPPLGEWIECFAKIRYNSEPVSARVRRTDDDSLEVRFNEPQFAVAPGQAVVCYDSAEPDVVLGGGWIDAAE